MPARFETADLMSHFDDAPPPNNPDRADILFVHTNFPGQFALIAADLGRSPDYRVFAIGSETARGLPGVSLSTYRAPSHRARDVHAFAARFDAEARRAEEVIYAANVLKLTGMVPRVIFVHPGWGESLPLRELFPDARICVYCEFYYRTAGADVGFDPEFAQFGTDGRTRIAARNAATLLALADADAGIAPTAWQRATFPAAFQDKISVIHDGIDAGRLFSRPATFTHPALPNPLRSGDEVVTYLARGLEPYRGFHSFMRALPAVLAARPEAWICIAGSDRVCYGTPPIGHRTWRDAMLAELRGVAGLDRVIFLGTLPPDRYLDLLRVTRAHVYLTYPFVLSWSILDAMALGALVIGSDTAPVREVIRDGETGLLVPFFEPDAIAARIVEVMAEPMRFGAIGSRARETVLSRYDFESRVRPAYHALIADLLHAEEREAAVSAAA
jgi:glycosyltransferase involved in cell wall biosynthesis